MPQTGLATEEMVDCPTCGVPTFEVGPCFACCAKAGVKKQRRSSGLFTKLGPIVEGDELIYNSDFHSDVRLRVRFGPFVVNPSPGVEVGVIGFHLEVLGSPFVWALQPVDAQDGRFEHIGE